MRGLGRLPALVLVLVLVLVLKPGPVLEPEPGRVLASVLEQGSMHAAVSSFSRVGRANRFGRGFVPSSYLLRVQGSPASHRRGTRKGRW